MVECVRSTDIGAAGLVGVKTFSDADLVAMCSAVQLLHLTGELWR